MNTRDLPYDDKRLLQLLAAGDLTAFRHLYNHYFPVLFRFLSGFVHDEDLAQDITQEIFIAVWEKRDRYADVENLRAYLYTIARNRAITVLKKLAQEQEAQMDFDRGAVTTGAEMTATEIEDALQKTVELLPNQQKRCYTMAYEGLNPREIAEQLGIAPNTVKVHLVEANRFIRTHLVTRYDLINKVWREEKPAVPPPALAGDHAANG